MPILPVSGAVSGPPGASNEPLTKELASPGSWSGVIGNVPSTVAVSVHSGIASFSFPPGGPAQLVIKAGAPATGPRPANVSVSGRRITGWAAEGSFCGAPVRDRLYFVIELDTTPRVASSFPGGTIVTFGSAPTRRVVLAKVGISYVDLAGAEQNLRAEIQGWSLARVASRARALWASQLDRISVSGGTTAQRVVFYTALYHASLAPETYSDLSGRYMGFDHRVHVVVPGHVEYSAISGWDVQLSEMPLLDVLDPSVGADVSQSLLNDAEQGGYFPRWPVAGADARVMEGDPAAPIIAESYAFGARSFDATAALSLLERAAFDLRSAQAALERPGGAAFVGRGLIPERRSLSLQYALDDFALSGFATALGDPSGASRLLSHGGAYSGVVAEAMAHPLQRGYVEGTANQYVFYDLQDLPALVTQLGGDQATISRLERLFSHAGTAELTPYYDAGNETDLGAPYVYDATTTPWQTQLTVRHLLGRSYTDSAAGLPGNDDMGEMSSWAVWSMIGLYPLVPGSDLLAMTTPTFSSVRIETPGASVHIVASGAADHHFVEGARFNGATLSESSTTWSALASRSRSTLRFELGTAPSVWGSLGIPSLLSGD